jgi:hypothetical protein
VLFLNECLVLFLFFQLSTQSVNLYLRINIVTSLSRQLIVCVEGHRLRVLGNRVLKRIFGPKRDEVTGTIPTLHQWALIAWCSVKTQGLYLVL